MNDRTKWALLYKYNGDLPREFYEVRLFDSSVWTATGNALTWGESDTTDYADPDTAQSEFEAECEKAIADGFVLTRKGVFDPRRFDFEALTREIHAGARKAFTAVRNAHLDQTIDSFALFSDDSAMTIAHAANSTEVLANVAADVNRGDTIWNCAEWSFDEGGEYLDIAYRMILLRQGDIPWEIDFGQFRTGVFESCISALEQLDREGYFGQGDAREDVILLFQVSDSEEVEGAMERLNTPAAFARYQAWYDSWH